MLGIRFFPEIKLEKTIGTTFMDISKKPLTTKVR